MGRWVWERVGDETVEFAPEPMVAEAEGMALVMLDIMLAIALLRELAGEGVGADEAGADEAEGLGAESAFDPPVRGNWAE
ncbi:hypothetical protein A7L51_19825 [Acinetobacter baumannii]|nr:hypothetical protein A7L51_19825 [Acinetobacter baumannii]